MKRRRKILWSLVVVVVVVVVCGCGCVVFVGVCVCVCVKQGNFINYGTPRGAASAIRFDALEKLATSKCNSVEFKNLLHVLVHECCIVAPDVLKVSVETFETCAPCKRTYVAPFSYTHRSCPTRLMTTSRRQKRFLAFR